MAINGITYGTSSVLNQSVLNLKNQMTVLQSQLTSGVKSTTYAGMGVNEGFAIAARSQLSNISAFTDTMTNINTAIGIANTGLQSMVDIGNTMVNAANSTMQTLNSGGQTIAQTTAYSQLSSMLGILNLQAGDRYLFSGNAINTPAVAPIDTILNGTTTQAGLKQVISERQQADLGTNGLGRLIINSPTATSVQVVEDAAGSPFGLKLSAVSSSLTGATVTGPAGSPSGVSISLGATNPNDGDKVSFSFNLPDGTTELIQLTASSATPPPTGSFAIGATPAATAANLNAALTTAIGTLANTSLVAASAIQAGNDFFDSGRDGLREAGSPTRLRLPRRSAARRCCPVARARTRWVPVSRPATPSPSTARRSPLSPPAPPATRSMSPTASRRCSRKSIRLPAPRPRRPSPTASLPCTTTPARA